MKDKEWLKEEVKKLLTVRNQFYPHDEMVDLGFVLLAIDQLDEPEKPVIPQFVADWIDTHNLYGNNPLREYRDLENDFSEGWTDEKDAAVYHWVNKNPYAFIDALRYGYEVEKEKLYRIKFSDNQYASRFSNEKISSALTDEELAAQYTESEIKAIDKRFWSFAEEVKE